MSRGPLRERWRREVFRSVAITDSTRVLLLVLVDEMDQRGYVAVPRDVLARRLNRSDRVISARFEDAVNARLLDRVVRGHRGTTTVYRAMVPDAKSARTPARKGEGSGQPMTSPNHHPMKGERVNHGVPALIEVAPKSETPKPQRHRPSPPTEVAAARSVRRNTSEREKVVEVEPDPADVEVARRACRLASLRWTGEIPAELGDPDPQTNEELFALEEWAARAKEPAA